MHLEATGSDLRPVRILSVDGGGIRGIVPSVMLVALQQRLAQPVADYFDVVAGTSTGGLVAAALCAPGPGDAPRYTPTDILRLYTDRCRQIFHRSLLHTVRSLDGLRLPKYPAAGMNRFLLDVFGDMTLAQARRLLMLVTYDIERRSPHVLCSARALEDDAKNFLVRDACRATTAAPTFFPAATITSLDGTVRHFIDGGVCSNDPTLPGFVEADQEFPGRPVMLVSLGTGNLTESLDLARAPRWGAVGWASRILEVLEDGQSGMSENNLKHLARSRERTGSSYVRFQPDVPPGLGRMDDTSHANVSGLVALAQEYCSTQEREFDRVARLLEGCAA
jgi:predicted acylesterase/phospholipase RssA